MKIGNIAPHMDKIIFLFNNHFNKNGKDNELIITSLEAFPTIKIHNKKDTTAILVTNRTISPTEFQLVISRCFTLTYLASKLDNYVLSNFTVKVCNAMHGTPAVLNAKKDIMYLGIDIGHDHKNSRSQLAFVLVNAWGIIIIKRCIETALKENLCEEHIAHFFNALSQEKINLSKHLVIHRDGKMHKHDVHILTTVIKMFSPSIKIDILAITKRNIPYLFQKDNSTAQACPTGHYWIIPNKKYAILQTNDQLADKGMINEPLGIKHEYGDTPFTDLINQVYWLANIFQKTIYEVSHLPITLYEADRIGSTGNRRIRKN